MKELIGLNDEVRPKNEPVVDMPFSVMAFFAFAGDSVFQDGPLGAIGGIWPGIFSAQPPEFQAVLFDLPR